MAATIIDIADAVVALLNGQTWTPAFTAARSYQPTYKPEQLASIKVAVVPGVQPSEPAARKKWKLSYTLWVTFTHRPATFDNAALDADMLLVEQVQAFFEGQEKVTAGGVEYPLLAVNNEVMVDPEQMEQRQFMSVLTLTLRGWR